MTEEERKDLIKYLQFRFGDENDTMHEYARVNVFTWFANMYDDIPSMESVKNYLEAYDRVEWQKELDEKKLRVSELEDLLGAGLR